jgi:phosphatidylserine/phosphatidylglycerophosphate/cardiolipin synthase-like enzyme
VSSPLRRLGTGDLLALAKALRTERLGPPFSTFALRRALGTPAVEAVAAELERLSAAGAPPAALAESLELLAEERTESSGAADHTELVWTGPTTDSASTRDTAVVLRELFASAATSVLVAGFAVYQGKDVFRALAERLDGQSQLAVRMFLNVGRDSQHDQRSPAEVLARFSDDFRGRQWPGKRLPEVLYDPRSLETAGAQRASLHAKCVVVDALEVFVTSANFTEAAQARNIEVGIRLRDAAVARSLVGRFEGLAASGQLLRVPGL